MADEWYRREPGLENAWNETRRLMRRARAYPIRSAVVAALLGLVVAQRTLREKPVVAFAVLKVEEVGLTVDDQPMPSGNLRSYIADISLSSDRLWAVIQELGMYPGLGRDEAVLELRMAMDIAVFRNYFLTYKYGDDDFRSARIRLEYPSYDAERAADVVVALARTIIDFEFERRRDAMAVMEMLSARAVNRARRQLVERTERLASRIHDVQHAGGADTAQARIEIEQLVSLVAADKLRLDNAETRYNEVALLSSAEHSALGLRFEIIDILRPSPPPPRGRVAAIAGVMAFLLALPLCGFAFAAFDTRVYEEDDLLRLGFDVMGHVPRFDGWKVGSLRQRGVRRGGRRRIHWGRLVG